MFELLIIVKYKYIILFFLVEYFHSKFVKILSIHDKNFWNKCIVFQRRVEFIIYYECYNENNIIKIYLRTIFFYIKCTQFNKMIKKLGIKNNYLQYVIW